MLRVSSVRRNLKAYTGLAHHGNDGIDVNAPANVHELVLLLVLLSTGDRRAEAERVVAGLALDRPDVAHLVEYRSTALSAETGTGRFDQPRRRAVGDLSDHFPGE